MRCVSLQGFDGSASWRVASEQMPEMTVPGGLGDCVAVLGLDRGEVPIDQTDREFSDPDAPQCRQDLPLQSVAVQLDGARAAPLLFEGGEPQGGHVTDPCVRGDAGSGVCPRPVAQRFDERSGCTGLRLADALDGPRLPVEIPIQSPDPKSVGRSVRPGWPRKYPTAGSV